MSTSTPDLSTIEPIYWLCIICTAVIGLLLAKFDTAEIKYRGQSPASHLASYLNGKDGHMSNADLGLGLLEPHWKLFTLDHAQWARFLQAAAHWLSTIAAPIFGVFSWLAALVRPENQTKATKKDARKVDKAIEMTRAQQLSAYSGYIYLFSLGILREICCRIWALLFNDEVAKRYLNRERWTGGWVEFYLQHMYKHILDCFSRPISSAPDACMDVVTRVREGGMIFGPLHSFECTQKSKRCVNLSSYNYLGFGGIDENCTPAARAAVLQQGFCSAATRTEGGTCKIHLDLEEEVARFLGKDDALVLGMGFATNSTILPALFEAQTSGQGVLVISDELNHRSIVEGVRLSGAVVRAFAHNCMVSLESELQRAVEEGQPITGCPWRKVFVVVEGIYSMEGDFCRLREVVTLKNRYNAYLYLDEAHSIGAVGATGRGVTELLGVPTKEVDIMMGTFTKSFGSAGGYVASSKAVINALRQNAPGSFFSSSMAPPCAAQALAALQVISGTRGGTTGADKLKQIRDNSNFFRLRLEEAGFKVLGDIDSPIIPVMLHHPLKMAAFSRRCLEEGVAIVIVGYPAVPVLYERARFCISAAHTRDQLADTAAKVTSIGREIGVLFAQYAGPRVIGSRQEETRTRALQLRTAPLESHGVVSWTPESLTPATMNSCSSAAALQAAMEVTPAAALDFRLFDPLGYISHQLKEAQDAAEAVLNVYGFGACGPRGFYGTTMPHLELETKIARTLGVESAIAYSAGVVTASSVLPALVQKGDHVIIDSEAHLGILTGLRLCRAKVTWVATGDVQAVKAALSEGAQGKVESVRTFVVVEAICQRTGAIAPLAELVQLKEQYGATLILDESLSIGSLGEHGLGLSEYCGIAANKIDAVIGSLEHGLGGVGGFCAGRKALIEHQRLAGAGYCFSAACPPSACSASTATLEDMVGAGGKKRRQDLCAMSLALHQVLDELTKKSSEQIKLSSSRDSWVQHICWTGKDALSGERLLTKVARHCQTSGGVYVQVCTSGFTNVEKAFCKRVGAPFATVPSLRLCAAASHTSDDIGKLKAALEAAFDF